MQAQVAPIEADRHLLKMHFESLRDVLIKKEQQEKWKANIEMMLTMFTLGLTAVCGPVVKDLIKGMLHLADPALHLSASLAAAGEEKVAAWCSSAAKSKAVEVATKLEQPPSFVPGNHGRDEEEDHALTLQGYENQRLDDFPYHFAIQQSRGDFDEFLHLLGVAEEDARCEPGARRHRESGGRTF